MLEEVYMLKSAVSSFLISIHRARQAEAKINLRTNFSSCPNKDIIDIISDSLDQTDVFNLPTNTTENVETDNQVSAKKIKLVEIIERKTETKDDVALYKYVYFKVQYGENGDKSRVEKPDGKEIDINSDDYIHRDFHVFLAYPDDDEALDGVLLLESRGSHGIQTPIRTVLKQCVSQIGDNYYTMDINHFVDQQVIERYIDQGKISKLRLIKNTIPQERGAAMQYDSAEIIYSAPRGKTFKEYLKSTYSNSYAKNGDNRINEINVFDPDIIKFEVNDEDRKRTYTVGRINAGIIQEELQNVVDADGITNSQRLLVEMKRIVEAQHINLGSVTVNV